MFTLTFSLLALLLVTPVWSAAQEPGEASEEGKSEEVSLAALARRERERRARNNKEVRVITNATLKQIKGGRISVAEAPPPPEGSAEGEGEAQAEAEKDMAAWRAEFEESRLNVKNAVNRSLVLQLKMNDLRNSYLREDDGATQARIQQQLQETLQQIEENKAETEKARQELQKLQNEAKGSGLPPGTIRELTGDLPQEESIVTTPASR